MNYTNKINDLIINLKSNRIIKKLIQKKKTTLFLIIVLTFIVFREFHEYSISKKDYFETVQISNGIYEEFYFKGEDMYSFITDSSNFRFFAYTVLTTRPLPHGYSIKIDKESIIVFHTEKIYGKIPVTIKFKEYKLKDLKKEHKGLKTNG